MPVVVYYYIFLKTLHKIPEDMMALTITEQLIKNREERQRCLLAQKEKKSVRQISVEEGNRRIAKQLAGKLSIRMKKAFPGQATSISLTEKKSDIHRADQAQEKDVQQTESLCSEVKLIRILIERFIDKFDSFSRSIQAAGFNKQQDVSVSSHQQETSVKPVTEEEKKIPIGDISSIVDHLQGIYR